LVEGAAALAYPVAAGNRLFWQESRPAEAGRVVLVRRGDEGTDEVSPPEFSARTTAHEYGGRAWAVGAGGKRVVSSNFADQRLWVLEAENEPYPLTPEPPERCGVRFACPAWSPDGSWVVAVRESHQVGAVLNDLVALRFGSSPVEPVVLAEGHDFYSSPVFSPDGEKLAFVCWDQPDMPWDRTELWQGKFTDGRFHGAHSVVGSPAGESVLQPRWAPGGWLTYISDRTGWWNLYSEEGEPLAPLDADFAGPAWAFGDSDYTFLADGTLIATWKVSGAGFLGEVRKGTAKPFNLPYTAFAHLAAAGDSVLVVAGGPAVAPELVRVSDGGGAVEVLRRSQPARLPPEWVSVGEPFTFPTGEGEEAHAIYYPPQNPEQVAPPGEKPPVIVTSHGGPTSAASSVLELRTQFWTTRGFGVVDVDYRGSTGYGRAFRRSLEGRWGLADAEDCAAAAEQLVRWGRADPRRVVIRGSSASGLTVLSALARYPVFAAGTVLFGVADLALLARQTHKFERHYLERLVPEAEWAARSPMQLVGRVTAPVLFFHGLDDRVVPPEQSRAMAKALRSQGVTAVLIELEGEGHGFRRAESLVRVQEAELAFYGEVLGFEPAGDLSAAKASLAAGRNWQPS
jgi:dipeptidyl aminopeptidase/acylaminoacyl peptidase